MATRRPRLSERIVFEREAVTTNGAGGVQARGWVRVCTVSAEVVPLTTPVEIERRGGRQMVTRYRLTVRWRPDLTSAMRVRWGGRVLQLEGLSDPENDRAWLLGTGVEGEPV